MSESTFTVSTEVFIAVNTPFIMGPALKNSPLMNGIKKRETHSHLRIF